MIKDRYVPVSGCDVAPPRLSAGGGYAYRPYSASDPSQITPREDFAIEHEAAGRPLTLDWLPSGPSFTLTEGPARQARAVACGGFEPLGHGRWSLWLYASDLRPMGWAAVARALKRELASLGDRARRIELCVRFGPSAAKALDYARWLGFENEGRMRSWGPDGADYWLLSLIPGGGRTNGDTP